MAPVLSEGDLEGMKGEQGAARTGEHHFASHPAHNIFRGEGFGIRERLALQLFGENRSRGLADGAALALKRDLRNALGFVYLEIEREDVAAAGCPSSS
jgi:hypothetical protein